MFSLSTGYRTLIHDVFGKKVDLYEKLWRLYRIFNNWFVQISLLGNGVSTRPRTGKLKSSDWVLPVGTLFLSHTGQLCRNPTSWKHNSKMLCESPRNPNFQGPVVTYHNEVYFLLTIFFEIVSCLQNMRWDS